jgi:putative pyruvate formate lyase activating enzyme
MCPRKCRVDRLSGESGVCKTSGHAVVAAAEAHFGEESPLVGTHGSGTIFFSYCSLLCKFCQNYDISHKGYGRAVSSEELADMMISLQRLGCHNINLVTPSHVVFQILESIPLAVEKGLRIPLIYNSSGYDAVETLRLLDGVVDIYMPDFKFWDPKVAQAACSAPDYPEIARTGISEMHRQVGDIVIGEDGVARRGLLLRHLVLPNAMAGTREVMRFVARELSRDTYVNIMNQYRPLAMASEVPGFERRPTRMEFESAVAEAGAEGIHRLDRPVRTFVLH